MIRFKPIVMAFLLFISFFIHVPQAKADPFSDLTIAMSNLERSLNTNLNLAKGISDQLIQFETTTTPILKNILAVFQSILESNLNNSSISEAAKAGYDTALTTLDSISSLAALTEDSIPQIVEDANSVARSIATIANVILYLKENGIHVVLEVSGVIVGTATLILLIQHAITKWHVPEENLFAYTWRGCSSAFTRWRTQGCSTIFTCCSRRRHTVISTEGPEESSSTAGQPEAPLSSVLAVQST